MKYTVDYLTKQFEEVSGIRERHTERLAANPNDIASEIVAAAMTNHLEEIQKDLAIAKAEESIAAVTRNLSTEVCVASMISSRGKIDLEFPDGSVIHGNYPPRLFSKVRNIRLGDPLKCTIESDTLLEVEPVAV